MSTEMAKMQYLYLLFYLLIGVNSFKYNIEENKASKSLNSPLSETECFSVRHCSHLCTINTECTSASYDPQTGNCQLMGNNTWNLRQDGRMAVIKEGAIGGEWNEDFMRGKKRTDRSLSARLVCGMSWVRIPFRVIPIILKVVLTASLPRTRH